MEESPEELPGSSHFSQVVFLDVQKSYVPGTDVTCRYSLSPGIVPRPKDWVGIFRVGKSRENRAENQGWTLEGKGEGCFLISNYEVGLLLIAKIEFLRVEVGRWKGLRGVRIPWVIPAGNSRGFPAFCLFNPFLNHPGEVPEANLGWDLNPPNPNHSTIPQFPFEAQTALKIRISVQKIPFPQG